jgi:hypothetical protein
MHTQDMPPVHKNDFVNVLLLLVEHCRITGRSKCNFTKVRTDVLKTWSGGHGSNPVILRATASQMTNYK